MDHRTRVLSLAALAAFSFLTACGSDDGAASGDQASVDSAAPAAAAAADTSMAGMQHAAARDADQEFARMMVDHHPGRGLRPGVPNAPSRTTAMASS